MPPAIHFLEPLTEWTGPVDFGLALSYGCADQRKFEEDFFMVSQDATCLVGDSWEPPAEGWKNCVKSETIKHLNPHHFSFPRKINVLRPVLSSTILMGKIIEIFISMGKRN